MRRVMLLVMVAFVGLSACSSGGGSSKAGGPTTSSSVSGLAAPTVPSTVSDVNQGWSPADVSAIRVIAIRLQRAVPQQCLGVQLIPKAGYIQSIDRLHVTPAKAVADCDMFGDTAETSLFHDASARDKYIADRTSALCSAVKKAKASLPALFWVVGDDYAIQFQHEGSARNVASAMGAQYRGVPCPGHSIIEWDPAAESRATQLAAQLNARRNLKCTGNQFFDYSQYANDAKYKNRLPAAYSQCQGPGSSMISIAVFNPQTITPAKFVAGETKVLCTAGGDVAAVTGKDFALLVTHNDKVAELAAAATGGTASGNAC